MTAPAQCTMAEWRGDTARIGHECFSHRCLPDAGLLFVAALQQIYSSASRSGS